MKKLLLLAGLAAMVMFVATPVHAVAITTETFNFTSNEITDGTFGTIPFGDVVLTQVGSNVDITVNLFNGNEFVNTGAGANQNFLFNGTSSVTTANMSALGGESLSFTGTSGSFGLHADGAGFFDFGVVFTGQGTGGANKLPGPITFEVAGVSISDLTISNAAGELFAADIILGNLDGANGTSFGATGVVDASATKVPEPATMLLLGLGLVGLAGVRRMLKN
jgi:hypothetical protein